MDPKEGSHGQDEERRVAPRVAERCRVVYRILRDGVAEPKTHAGRTINLSASGVCIEGPARLDRDQSLALEISLPGVATPIFAMGRVIWCDGGEGGYRTGLAFAWLREDDRKALGALNDFLQTRLGG